VNLLRQRQFVVTAGGDKVQLDASVMLLLGGAKAGVSQLGRDPPTIGARATSEHHQHKINQPVVGRLDLPCRTLSELFNQALESRSQFIQAAIEGLRGRQGRKPRSPMMTGVIIDAAASGVPLEMSEDVHRQKFFVRKQWLVIIAQALLFEDGFRIVETAD
jgi:hypothetical protein